jgi:hypothetical protein
MGILGSSLAGFSIERRSMAARPSQERLREAHSRCGGPRGLERLRINSLETRIIGDLVF